MATEGTFILADIGGYTGFLTGVGIEHGKEITSHLLNSLLKCNRGRWKLGNIEGDCLFLYREGGEPPGELLNHVRMLYEDFCDRTIDIAARASCPCGACSRTNELSLKFIVHAGQFDTQRIGNREELIGPDIVIAHRLLKNSVPLGEYALLTEGYTLGVMPDGLPAVKGGDEAEGVGRVPWVALDLAPLRADLEATRRFFVSESEARLAMAIDIHAQPELVWRTIDDREKRAYWLGHKEITVMSSPRAGKIGEVHRCVHGDGRTTVEVMIAFDEQAHRLTMRTFPSRLVKEAYFTIGADERPAGSSHAYFNMKFREAIPGISHAMSPLIVSIVRKAMRASLDRLKAMCEEEAGRQAA